MTIGTELAIPGTGPCGLFPVFKLQRLHVDGPCANEVA